MIDCYKWTKVSDGLPKVDEDVLVTNGDRIMLSTYQDDGDFSYDYNNNVTHWMPLPRLPY